MYYIWRCILFSAFGGCIHPPNKVHRKMCIYKGIIKLIRMKRQFKFTPNSQKLKFRQISYTLNLIHLQYILCRWERQDLYASCLMLYTNTRAAIGNNLYFRLNAGNNYFSLLEQGFR